VVTAEIIRTARARLTVNGVLDKLYISDMQKDRIIDHLERLLYVARNAACHRALSKYKDELNQVYWKLIWTNFFDIAILEWCKIFGSKREKTHWEKLVDDPVSFYQGLLNALEIDKTDWESYQKDLKKYRDTFIAHHQKDLNRTYYPRLDIALESSFYYYSWLVNNLEQLNIYFDDNDLKEYYDDFLLQISIFADVSYLSTQNIK
jgi:hypothetical protein